MFSLPLVMIGGAFGAGARYLVGRWLTGWLGQDFPWATLTVNIGGGLAMGILAGLLARLPAGEQLRLFAGVGLLGGFTTFSAFSLEMMMMVERGAVVLAFAYALVSVLGALAALFGGLALSRAIL